VDTPVPELVNPDAPGIMAWRGLKIIL